MSSAPNAHEIANDATWLAQALDPVAGMVRLIAMDRESYRLASFLDDRMLQQPVDARTFLGYVAGPADGYAISQCLAQTTLLCAKGSRALACVGGTGTKPRL